MSICNWKICITGYKQHTGELTGLAQLWMRLGVLRSPDTCVVLREWNSDWEELADLIWVTSSAPVVHIYAYSWGAGYGFVQLAKALGRRGVRVVVAVLCDPVYRSLLWCFRWLALVQGPVIRIPPKVDEVWSFFQRVDKPGGHTLKTTKGSSTILHPPQEIRLGHQWMDECGPFQNKVLELVGIEG